MEDKKLLRTSMEGVQISDAAACRMPSKNRLHSGVGRISYEAQTDVQNSPRILAILSLEEISLQYFPHCGYRLENHYLQ